MYKLKISDKGLEELMQLEFCKHETNPKKMILKMGGLLCPKCRTIIYWPGDKEYTQELNGRRTK